MKFNITKSRQSFVAPRQGERVAMICMKCGCHCMAKKGGMWLSGRSRCPKCGRRSLVENPLVSY